MVATVRANGGPQSTVVWIDWDGENAVFNTRSVRAKGGHLARDPRVSIAVWDRNDPYRSLEIQGSAVLDFEGADEHIAALAREVRPPDVHAGRPRDRARAARARAHLRARVAVPSRSATSGPRDGLQNEPETLPAATRAELVSRLAAARLPRIEAVSFVRDDLVPQMAGAEEVVAAADRGECRARGLVLNERGYERFAATPLDRLNVTLAATETFNRRNGNASLAEAIARAQAVLAASERPATATLSCAFGCPFEGEVDPGASPICASSSAPRTSSSSQTRSAWRRRGGCGGSSSASRSSAGRSASTGTTRATPATRRRGPRSTAGATVLDASVGGLGGCPFSPNATGNVATEDLVWQLEREGVATGVDLDALVETARWLAGVLGHELDGYVHRAARFPAEAQG